ncbi:hypothetical protein CR513_39050, partial [Mucuna pruriens]
MHTARGQCNISEDVPTIPISTIMELEDQHFAIIPLSLRLRCKYDMLSRTQYVRYGNKATGASRIDRYIQRLNCQKLKLVNHETKIVPVPWDKQVKRYVERLGLMTLIDAHYCIMDTNSFHLSRRGMTITLDYVSPLLHLPIIETHFPTNVDL